MEKLNWKNLRNGKCPKCGGLIKANPKLRTSFDSPINECEDCDFKISDRKLESFLKNMSIKNPYREIERHDNLSDLNNLGHETVTEDFSDSPALKNL